MYTRVLVAIDQSEVSTLALRKAIALAHDQQAKLCIVYVANEFVPSGEGIPVDFNQYEDDIKKQSLIFLEKAVLLARHALPCVEYRLVEVTESDDLIPQKIVAAANEWQADLIVLGTHGRKGLPRLLLGSVAEEVVRHTIIPVHLVQAGPKTSS